MSADRQPQTSRGDEDQEEYFVLWEIDLITRVGGGKIDKHRGGGREEEKKGRGREANEFCALRDFLLGTGQFNAA